MLDPAVRAAYLADIGVLGRSIPAMKLCGSTQTLSWRLVDHAPEKAELHARNPDYNLTLGADEIIFSSVMCPPFANDLDRGRRNGTFEEMCEFVKLVHSINAVHQAGGGGFEPLDLPAETRHLDVGYAHATLTDKTWKAWVNGRERARDAISMAKIMMGQSDDDLAACPVLTAPINTNSPLMIDAPMAEGIIEMARAAQAPGDCALHHGGRHEPPQPRPAHFRCRMPRPSPVSF